MTAILLDGKQIAEQIRSELTGEVAAFVDSCGIRPRLAAILVGDFDQRGVRSEQGKSLPASGHRQPRAASWQPDQRARVAAADRATQSRPGRSWNSGATAAARHIHESRVLDAVHPLKDVDAFHPENVGRMVQGRPRFLPCTPHGISTTAPRSGIQVRGKHAVVIGRSDIVGKPMALMLMNRAPAWGRTGPTRP